MIFDTTPISTDQIDTYVNQVHAHIKLNPTYEGNRCINYLDLLIFRKDSNIETDIHRKPTTMDTTINFFSNHPMEHKLAAYRYHIMRMHCLPLTPERKQAEWTSIQLIAPNNNFPRKILLNLNQKIKHKRSSLDENNGNKNKIWTTFT